MFVGLAMVMHSIYEEKLRRAKRHARVEYRFIPRTLYDEQTLHAAPLTGARGAMRKLFSP